MIFERRLELPVSVDSLFQWHLRPGAFERMTPPWEKTKVISNDGVRDGGRAVLETHIGPTTQRFVAEHKEVVPGRGFVDEQVEGPFHRWRHEHRMESIGVGMSALTDHIEYELPLGGLGQLFGGSMAERRLEQMFTYRHAVLADDLARHRGTKPLTIAVTGASGMIGRHLVAMLTSGGHTVKKIVRKQGSAEDIRWDGRAEIERDKLVGVDVVVHLAGENIGDGRWNDEKKKKIVDSRVEGTSLVARTLAEMKDGPRALVSASAIGFYGNAGEVDEASPRGEGFLADVCEAWERAADPARAAGIRVAHPRIGIVLTPEGGALPPLVTATKAGVGGRIGDGKQGLSWIAIDDVIGVLHALVTQDRGGVFNATAPKPVDNATFVHELGNVLHRPTIIPLPAAAVKLMMGEMGERLLLDGCLARPHALEDVQHRFAYPTLEGALRHVLGR